MFDRKYSRFSLIKIDDFNEVENIGIAIMFDITNNETTKHPCFLSISGSPFILPEIFIKSQQFKPDQI